MYCSKCGNLFQENEKFCSKCGNSRITSNPNNNSNVSNMNYNSVNSYSNNRSVNTNNNNFNNVSSFNNTNNFNNSVNYSNSPMNWNSGTVSNNNFTNSLPKKKFQWNLQKTLIVAIVVVFLITGCLLTTLIFPIGSKGGSRTVMIYMVGSNLESQAGLATRDLKDLDYSLTFANDVNILLIAGGTKSWHNNFVDVNESSIYELGPNGFQKVDARPKTNMGDADNLSYFLNYVYDHYKSKSYDFIYWNHGGAVDGSEYDEFTNDNLKVQEMKKAFENSPFKGNNKLEVLSFRTCLNSTIEIANMYKDYANYLVASEETTVGSQLDSAIRFLNQVTPNDTAIDYGKKQIKVYQETVTKICNFQGRKADEDNFCVNSTYSIVDLSKVVDLKETVNEFANDLDQKLDQNYAEFAKLRSNMNQYAGDQVSYDMVDLYDLADSFLTYSPNAEKVKSSLEEAVVYNWTNNSYSHGLSVYFPFHHNAFLRTYSSLDFSDDYEKFITKFYNMKENIKVTSYESFSNMSGTVERVDKDGADVQIELTDEQIKNIAKSNYLVFVDTKDGYYEPIYNGFDVKIDGNKLKANVKNRILKVSDYEYEDYSTWILTVEDKVGDDYVDLKIPASFNNSTDVLDTYDTANLIVRIDKEHPNGYIRAILTEMSDEKNDTKKESFSVFSPMSISIKDYRFIHFFKSRYRLIDENGNFDNKFESADSLWRASFRTDEFKFIHEDFSSDYDFYLVFRVLDIAGNEYDSKPIKLVK